MEWKKMAYYRYPTFPKSLDKKRIDAQVMNDMGRWLVFKDKCDSSMFTRQGEADSRM